MSKKDNVAVRLTKEHEEMVTIPKLNSVLFTADNYNPDNSILLDKNKLVKYAVGWCYSDETTISRCYTLGGEMVELGGEIAIMFEIPKNEEIHKYWHHIGLDTFICLFIPKMLEEDNKPSLVEQLKQQLAEKDEEILKWKDGTMICNYEKMLAEKDKYIDELEQEREFMLDEVKNRGTCGLCEKLEEKAINVLRDKLKEKDKEIERLKTIKNARQFNKTQSIIEEFEKKLREDGVLFVFNSKEMSQHDATVRHQICEEIRERIVKETCYDTEEEVRNAIYDFNAREVLEILDQIEKGEQDE